MLNAKVYRGNGTAWSLLTDENWKNHVQIAESITSSPSSATPHWVAEIKVEHLYFNLWPEIWIRVAAEDIHQEAGYQTWPPESNRDNPNDYGLLNIPDAIPEFSTWIILPLLMVVSSLSIILLRRRGVIFTLQR